MKILKDGRIRMRVRITGTYKEKTFTYEDPVGHEGSQFYWPPEGEETKFDPSEYWWSEGNLSCDCNRAKFIGVDEMPCGETISIDKIEPIEKCNYDLPILYLNGTDNSEEG